MRQYRVLALGVAIMLALAGQSIVGRAGQAPATAAAGGPVDAHHIRPNGLDVGSDLRHRRLRGEPRGLLRRHGARRHLEDGEQRHDVRGPVPGSRADLDRRSRHLAEQPGPRVGRHGRVEQPSEHVVGRRRLQISRRRQDVHERRPAHVEAHQPRRHRPARERHRLRGGDRAALRARRRARRLQDDRRRQDVAAGAEGRRRDRRERSGDGSCQQPGALCVGRRAA